MPDLHQRDPVTGFPVGADALMRAAYGPIPDAREFLDGSGFGYATAETVHGWQWSVTFARWSALVTLRDGWHGFTYPKHQGTNGLDS